jgi:hypothetical protein
MFGGDRSHWIRIRRSKRPAESGAVTIIGQQSAQRARINAARAGTLKGGKDELHHPPMVPYRRT